MSIRQPSRPASDRPSRLPIGRVSGFTLVESMVVVAVLAVLAALGYGALDRLTTNGAYASSVNDLLSALRQTRAEAFGRGAPAVFVVDTVGRRWWSIADLDGNFSLEAFNPDAPAPAPDVLVLAGVIGTGVSFGPESGFGGPLPAPFAVVPASKACSFCLAEGTRTGFGAITFRPGGGALFTDGALAGGSMTLQQVPQETRRPTTIVVNGRTGATQFFERRTP